MGTTKLRHILKNLGSSTPRNNYYALTYLPSHRTSKLDEKEIWDTAGEARTNL